MVGVEEMIDQKPSLPQPSPLQREGEVAKSLAPEGRGQGERRRKPYPVYKYSGVEWLGEIPEHWEVIRLKFLSSESAVKLSSKPEELPYIGLENVESNSGRLILDNPQENVESSVNLFDRGDVLFGKLRPYLAKVLLSDFRGTCTTELLVLKPKNEVFASYLFYSLLSDGFIKIINSMTYGAKMPRANWQQIGNMIVSFPPFLEQRDITTFLHRETIKIDALIAKKQRLIELLQEKRIALISYAVTKGLNPNAPMKESGVGWLGEVPEEWEILPLKRLGRVRYGLGQPPKEQFTGKPLIRATNINSGKITTQGMIYIDPQDVPVSRDAELRDGEIIVVRSGAYTGDSAIVPPEYAGAIAGYDMILTLRKGHEGYFAWQILSSHVRDLQFNFYKLRAAQPHLNAEELKNTIVAVPPTEEQHFIATFIDCEIDKIDAMITKIQEAIQKLNEYRIALISAAVTGKIDVRMRTLLS